LHSAPFLFAASPLTPWAQILISEERSTSFQYPGKSSPSLPHAFSFDFLFEIFFPFRFMLDLRSKTLSSFSKDTNLKLKPLLTTKPLLIFQFPQIQTEIRSQICHGESPRSCPGLPGSPGSWVDPPGRSGFAGSLHRPVFWQTRTGPTTGSTESQVDPPDRFGFNNYVFNMIFLTPSNLKVNKFSMLLT
jgi:hypothetical protein